MRLLQSLKSSFAMTVPNRSGKRQHQHDSPPPLWGPGGGLKSSFVIVNKKCPIGAQVKYPIKNQAYIRNFASWYFIKNHSKVMPSRVLGISSIQKLLNNMVSFSLLASLKISFYIFFFLVTQKTFLSYHLATFRSNGIKFLFQHYKTCL